VTNVQQSQGRKKNEENEREKEIEEQMPPMRNDVFNLDHQFIMNKVMYKI
jgi:hypothetical protein